MTSRNLQVFVVWLPMRQTDAESHVPRAMTTIPDARVTHFWDGQGALSKAYSSILGLQYDLGAFDRTVLFRWLLKLHALLQGGPKLQPAWDVYMLFNRQVRWQEEPPRPDFWMHQLRLSEAKRLNGDRLAAAVRQRLPADG